MCVYEGRDGSIHSEEAKQILIPKELPIVSSVADVCPVVILYVRNIYLYLYAYVGK